MSTASAEAPTAPHETGRTFADRALAAIPVLVVAISLVVLYAVEAWLRKTPFVFTDEAEWTQISRAIATTGHSARRGQPVFFKSLYAYLIAPAWWIHSTATAYAVIKYINVVVMTAAAIPTYFLARMLVTKRSAFVVAVLSVLIPGMSYASSIVIEVLAYPTYALSSLLIVRALVLGRRRDWAFAVIACVAASFVRWPQFATVPISFAIAAGILWFVGPRGHAMRANWTKRDYVGAVALFYGALILFNRVVLQHEPIWQISTQYWKGRMVDLGLKAALALTVGMGILPIVGGFASLRLKERQADPRYRAFAAYLAASIICVGLYTAVKAAYLSTVFSTLTEERNLIYLSPLFLIGTAIVFESRRVDWRIVVAASAFVLYLVWFKSFQLFFPYYEAPGFAILTIPTRHWSWTILDLRLVLVGVLALGLLALRFRRLITVAATAAVLCAAWMLASEIATTDGILRLANDKFRRALPAQLNWVDQDVHGQHVTYLGQEIADPTLVLLMEFWNRSIDHVESLDGSMGGPGPAPTPNVISPDGALDTLGDAPYVLADQGVDLQAKVVDSWANMRLYKRTGPWKLLDALQQVYSDSWAPAWSTYMYFRTGQHGTLHVDVSRLGYNGPTDALHRPGHVVITVGTLGVKNTRTFIVHRLARRRFVLQNHTERIVNIPITHTPFRVVITVTPTMHVGNDPRNLGAQVGFQFTPSKR